MKHLHDHSNGKKDCCHKAANISQNILLKKNFRDFKKL
jgi:hypothetical protein